jgi:PAS domain S-box-containing protein
LSSVSGDFGAVLQTMRKGESGFERIEAGDKRLDIAYAPIQGTPFSLGIVAQEDVLLSAVNDVREQVASSTRSVLYTQMLPIGLGIFAVILAIGFAYTRYLTKPIIELTEKTHRVMLGDFKQRITIAPVAASNEIGRLSEAFNSMTDKLAMSYLALEQKVQERTESLNVKVRELGDAKAKDDAILSSIGEGMIVTDSSGYIMLINQVAGELLGIDTKTALGKKASEYQLSGADGKPLPTKDQPLSAALARGEKITQSVEAVIGGVKKTINVTATPVIENDHIIGAIQIIRDITKEKEVDRMKTEFISIASHQLRTPLSAIKWFSEMLLGGDAGKLKDDQHEFVHNIAASTERMIELVNSLLNISRMESGRIIVEPKPTDLSELVSGIINDLKGKTEERKQTLIISVHKDLPKISLDQRLIGQVYLNLLTNAIKYTPKGGEISVIISRKGEDVISQVTDNGYGIPKSEQGKMFQKFFRATNVAKEETDGTGLGMYLVKAVIESSGGKIWFESEEGKGTTFWFSLPMSGMKAKQGEVTLD